VLSLDLETSLNYEEVLNVFENLHLLQEITFSGLFVDEVRVKFAQNRIVCPFKVVFVDLDVELLQLTFDILSLRSRNVAAEVEKLL
jgi:hypothetical protein